VQQSTIFKAYSFIPHIGSGFGAQGIQYHPAIENKMHSCLRDRRKKLIVRRIPAIEQHAHGHAITTDIFINVASVQPKQGYAGIALRFLAKHSTDLSVATVATG